MNLGIVGSGKIVETCLSTIKTMQQINCIAICSRTQSINKAKTLAKKYKITYVYTCFEDMLCNKEIDFIYIGINNHVHYDYAKKALLYNKNVIIEKPFAVSLKQAIELKKLAKKRRKFLYEAITTVYMPNYQRLLKLKQEIGKINLIQCNFSKVSSHFIEYTQGIIHSAFSKEDFGGALFDLNIYNITFVVGLLNEPEKMMYYYNEGYNGVDLSGVVILKYKDAVAYCTAAKDSLGENFAYVQGSYGYLKIYGGLNYCHKLEITINGQHCIYEEKIPYKNRMQYEFMEFEDQFIKRDYEKCYRILQQSIKVAEIIDKIKYC
ncbi:MAG: Gfo/Idh/MocA family oxidoreductase [Desulfosporosinus sp.]|nr:Gfo/Idh/MocA family oxidoreductase [Desulfosporosinus sp.]